MVEIVKFPKGTQPVQVAEEHLAYYTPEKSATVLIAPAKPRKETGLEAVELMYEYYNAA
ncbi:MAG: hypothetical protein H5U24_09920 [Thioclava marina]|jgi:hypothetical protein|uniref:hypothetical protein n=1 Tax=Thioclava TaxID=285107 RepID=UPI00143C02E5|nr:MULTISPECIES: hypothetical protein [Thioclava]MBC7145707.1 hypothetical protein [Thioclava marina]